MSGRRMRVLLVSHGHPSFSLGGAEVASHNLHRGLNEMPGIESHYLARAGHPVARHRDTALLSLRQREREILFHTGDYDHFRMSNRDTRALERDFVRYAADLRPDIVHFHHFLGLGLECLFALKTALPQVPVVVTFHEFLAICHNHGQMVKAGTGRLCYRASPAECAQCFPHVPHSQFYKREAFIKTFLELADLYISPSRFLIDRYVEWGLEADRFRFLENGLKVGEIAPPRQPGRGERRRGRFAFFGQVTEFKGVHVLLDAVARMPERVWGEDAALMLYGGNLEHQPPAFQQRFRDLLERAGPRVRFYGSYRNDELPQLMRNVDWVIMPSIWWENSPIVIQEAFLHGRPVICSNIGGMAEKVRDQIDGLHFRVGSAEDLVDRLTDCLTMPDQWDRLRANIRVPLDHHEAARQHADVYAALLAARRRPAAPVAVAAAN